jgi:leucyl/phenylalanyl-tRNA--protein transferase
MPVFRLDTSPMFPPTELAEPNGLLAIGGDLSPARLLEAYRQGIFPWFNEGDPILWWSPAPRLILLPHEFHLPRRLAREMKKQNFTLTADKAFALTIRNCAEFRGKNRDQTWITDDMQEAYCRLHELGYAHSLECWRDGKLAGGLYGLSLDRVFFGESMFSKMKDASKIALYALAAHAKLLNIKLIDCQMKTEHLLRFGAREISRSRFQEMLDQYICHLDPQKKWRLHISDKEEIGHADACQEQKEG